MLTAAWGIGLATGLHYAKGPAWAIYYHQGYRDGFKTGSMPLVSELHAEQARSQGNLGTSSHPHP